MFYGNEVYTSKLTLNINILLAFAFLLFIYFAYQIVQISLRPWYLLKSLIPSSISSTNTYWRPTVQCTSSGSLKDINEGNWENISTLQSLLLRKIYRSFKILKFWSYVTNYHELNSFKQQRNSIFLSSLVISLSGLSV